MNLTPHEPVRAGYTVHTHTPRPSKQALAHHLAPRPADDNLSYRIVHATPLLHAAHETPIMSHEPHERRPYALCDGLLAVSSTSLILSFRVEVVELRRCLVAGTNRAYVVGSRVRAGRSRNARTDVSSYADCGSFFATHRRGRHTHAAKARTSGRRTIRTHRTATPTISTTRSLLDVF